MLFRNLKLISKLIKSRPWIFQAFFAEWFANLTCHILVKGEINIILHLDNCRLSCTILPCKQFFIMSRFSNLKTSLTSFRFCKHQNLYISDVLNHIITSFNNSVNTKEAVKYYVPKYILVSIYSNKLFFFFSNNVVH